MGTSHRPTGVLLGCPWSFDFNIFFPKRDVYILKFIGLFLYDLCFESHLRTFSCCRSLSFFISSGGFIVCFPHLAY